MNRVTRAAFCEKSLWMGFCYTAAGLQHNRKNEPAKLILHSTGRLITA